MLDILKEVYINNFNVPFGSLKNLDTSIEIVEFIGTLSGLFGKFKTDKLELIVLEKTCA